MARPYSQDLRDRVINAVERDGMGCREAARRFEISASAAIKWVQRYRRLGDRRNEGTGGLHTNAPITSRAQDMRQTNHRTL
jgi:transposase